VPRCSLLTISGTLPFESDGGQQSDDTLSTAELGSQYRDPRETLRHKGSELRELGRL